jgi:hypothetical protein
LFFGGKSKVKDLKPTNFILVLTSALQAPGYGCDSERGT